MIETVKLARRLFQSHTVDSWLRTLEEHRRTGRRYTKFEDELGDNVSPKEAAMLILCEAVDQLVERITKKGKVRLDRFTFEDAEFKLLPRADADVTYQGKTKTHLVEGLFGIECDVLTHGDPYRKARLVFVSHPFHQYRMMGPGEALASDTDGDDTDNDDE